MELLPDFALKPADLKNVRLAAWTSKRSGAYPNGWNLRYTVLSANFLFLYTNHTDLKPKKIIILDDAEVAITDDYHEKKPFAFRITTRSGRVVTLATETDVERQRWVHSISNANYTNMYNRTRDAVKWLERCKDTVAPFLAYRAGIPVPEGAGSGALDGEAASARGPGAQQGPPPSGPESEAYASLKSSLTGGDVIETIIAMRVVALDASPLIARLEEEAAQARADLMHQAHAQGGGDEEHVRALEGELEATRDAHRKELDRNSSLAARISELNRELTDMTTRAAASRGPSSAEGELQSQVAGLRSHVQELEAQLGSQHDDDAAREGLQRQVRELRADLAEEREAHRSERDASLEERRLAAANRAELDAALQRTHHALTDAQRLAAEREAAVAAAEAAARALRADLEAAQAAARNAQAQAQAIAARQPPVQQQQQQQPPQYAVVPPPESPYVAHPTASDPRAPVPTQGGGGGSMSGRYPAPAPAPVAPAPAPGRRPLPGDRVTPAPTKQQQPAPAPYPIAPGTDGAGVPPPGAAGGAAVAQIVAASGATGEYATVENHFEHEWAPFFAEAQRLEREGAYADAEQQYAAVLDAKRDRCGPASAAVAASERDLGRVLALQKKFVQAEDHYLHAVRLSAQLLGDSHPNTACALTDLAAVLREQGKFEEAEAYASKAVDSLRAGVGPDDVSTATALYNLAGLAKRQAKYDVAEASYMEALRIFRARLGDGQGETADTLYQIGCLHRKRGDYMKAGQFFNQGADAYARCYGPADKRVVEATKRSRAMAEKLAGGGRGSQRAASHHHVGGGDDD